MLVHINDISSLLYSSKILKTSKYVKATITQLKPRHFQQRTKIINLQKMILKNKAAICQNWTVCGTRINRDTSVAQIRKLKNNEIKEKS